jgi:hypothetical protein
VADTAGPPREPGLDARIARLDAEIAYIRVDIAEIKSILTRISQQVAEMRGFIRAKRPDFAHLAGPLDRGL